MARVIACSFVVGAAGCSAVGPGFAHHPADCAMGVKWADCLPGTAGYNNGGGQQTRAQEVASHNVDMQSRSNALTMQCKASYETPALDPIRDKVELSRASSESAPTFEVAANNKFSSGDELGAIRTWAKLREECIHRDDNFLESVLQANDQISAANLDIIKSLHHEVSGRVSELIVSLYQQKITYGEFAQKRYEISRDAKLAENKVRQASAIADQQRQAQAVELAQRDSQNRIAEWSAYTQSVTARQPQTVYIQSVPQQQSVNCVSNKYGNIVQTNCN